MRDSEISRLNLTVVNCSKTYIEIWEDRKALQYQIHIPQEEASGIPKEEWKLRNEFSKVEGRIRLWVKRYAVSDISVSEHRSGRPDSIS